MTRVDEPGSFRQAQGYFEQLLVQALRCGISAAEFWAMTPAETFLTIEAYLWQMERHRRDEVTIAWLTAKLMRAKRLPPLARLLTAKKAKPLQGEELDKRRREFKDMTENIDLEALNGR